MRAALSALTAEEKEDECIGHVVKFRRAWAEGELWAVSEVSTIKFKYHMFRKLCEVLPTVLYCAQDVRLPDRLVSRQREEKRSYSHHQSVSITFNILKGTLFTTN